MCIHFPPHGVSLFGPCTDIYIYTHARAHTHMYIHVYTCICMQTCAFIRANMPLAANINIADRDAYASLGARFFYREPRISSRFRRMNTENNTFQTISAPKSLHAVNRIRIATVTISLFGNGRRCETNDEYSRIFIYRIHDIRLPSPSIVLSLLNFRAETRIIFCTRADWIMARDKQSRKQAA